MENTGQSLQEMNTTPLAQQELVLEEMPVKKSRKRLWLLIGILMLGMVLSVRVCQFLAEFALSIPGEMAQVEQVIDEYLTAMANNDGDRAFMLVSTGDAFANRTQLDELLQGNNFVVFEGYQELQLADFNLTQVAEGRYAEVAGYVSYDQDYVGDFTAVLVKEDGTWKIQAIKVTVPPDKFGQ